MQISRKEDPSGIPDSGLASAGPHLALLDDIAQVLAHASSEQIALSTILQRICTALGWQYGACWNQDEQTGHLTCKHLWHERPLASSAFVELSRRTSFEPGAGGLIRTALKTRVPLAVTDIRTLPGLRRASAALAAGLNSAFAFPLLVSGHTLGAMEFFCRDVRPRDDALIATACVLSTMVGEFLARCHAEGRYREFVELSSDAIIVQCRDAYVYANQAAADVLGADEPAQILGRAAESIVQADHRHKFSAEAELIYADRSAVPMAELQFVRVDGMP